MPQEIISQLNKLKEIKPDKSWKFSNKEILLNQISNSSKKINKISGFIILTKEAFRRDISPALRPALTFFFIILLILGGGFFSISAASEATPGSFLYTVKLVGEKTQFALAIDQGDKIKLGVKFAERRASELGALISVNERLEFEKVTHSLREEIVAVQGRLIEINLNDDLKTEAILGLAKDVDSKTKALRVALKKTKSSVSDSTSLINQKLDETTRSVEDTGLNALDTIIKNTDISDKMAQEDISNRVADRLKAVKEDISEIRNESEKKVFSAGLGKTDKGIEIYKTPQKEVDDKTKEAEKAIKEVENLLKENNYQGALQRINETRDLIGEAAEAINKFKEAAEKNSTSTEEAVETTKEGEVKGVIEVNKNKQQIINEE